MNDIQRLKRGRAIYDQITPYPLPYEPGKYRNYVVFFASTKKGYGADAQHFYRTYYNKHRPIKATSLEDMFEKIARDLRKSPEGIKIQELVIVAHGNRWGTLGVPVTGGGYGDRLNAIVIATLQQEIEEPKNSNFKFQREKVIAHFDEKSWVAVRACNFGYSLKGMFALYSLFGGRANLYGIRAYMTFMTYKKGSRFKDIYELYALLRKQGFLPRKPGAKPSLQESTLKQFATTKGEKVTLASIQSFMPSFINNEKFEGHISELVTQPAKENSPKELSLEKVVLQLDSSNPAGITTLLNLQNETFDIAGDIRIAPIKKNKIWDVSWLDSKKNPQQFLIKLKSPGGDITNVLSVYSRVSREQIYSADWAKKYLTNYDQPGCELHAQLDLYSIEDLTCLQTYIRANYKPKEAVLIEQAQRSIERRRIDYSRFFVETECYKLGLSSSPLAPLYRDVESCTWFPAESLGTGLAENEMNDLKARAHTDHRGHHIWVDVIVGQRKRKFEDDLFLERKLPFAKEPDEPDDPDFDVVDTEGDDTEKKKRKRKKKDYEFKFDKDPPPFGLSDEEEIDPKDVLRNLSDDELRELLEKALERIKDGTVSDDSEIGSVIDKTTLAIEVIFATASEISAWLPESALASITAGGVLFALDVAGTILLPLVGWVVLTIDFRSATERFRGWGMRTALREGSFALRELARDFTDGPIPKRPIKNWIISSKEAVAKERRTSRSNLPVGPKFHEGYNFVVKEITTLPNDFLDAVEKVVHKKFAAIGLSKAKIEIVLESGLVDINKVYGKTLMGLADFLIEVMRKIEKK